MRISDPPTRPAQRASATGTRLTRALSALLHGLAARPWLPYLWCDACETGWQLV